jgi:hypothetical protein
MAKRFTDTEKWKKPFIRSMKAPYKLLWVYILDECDHAGIWQVDLEVAEIKIGERLNLATAINYFDGKIHIFDSGQKWYIPDFVDFQYGKLNPLNRAHGSVINILEKYSLLEIKPLTSPLQGAMDMDKDKDKDKDTTEKKQIIEKTELDLAFESYIEMRKKIKKPATEHAIELVKKKLDELSKGNEHLKIKILNQSIVNCWQDIYELKQPQQGNKFQPIQQTKTYKNLD